MRSGGMGRTVAWVISCLATGVLALSLSACGGDSPEATAKAKTTQISASADDTSTGAAPKTKAPASSSCLTQLDPFLKAMDNLRTRLVSGLAYEEYVDAVRVIIAAYDEVPADELTLGCVQAVGTPGEKALNRYIAASNTWTDCVEVPSCEAATVEAPLQDKWGEASKYLSKAERGLSEPNAG
ncbi:MAG TPA: hypothetical protein VMS11_02215 [Solirubrobacterales bacterium]|nr:hypothetical protein [Solirubrobacterales bacterium]